MSPNSRQMTIKNTVSAILIRLCWLLRKVSIAPLSGVQIDVQKQNILEELK